MDQPARGSRVDRPKQGDPACNEVIATGLDRTQRGEFFRDVLGPLARGIRFGAWSYRIFDGVDLNDPVEIAQGGRVYELHPVR